MVFDTATIAGMVVVAVIAWFLWNNRDDRDCDDMGNDKHGRRH